MKDMALTKNYKDEKSRALALAASKNKEDKTFKQVVSNILASMITSLIAWFIFEQFKIEPMYKAIAYGLVGLKDCKTLVSELEKVCSEMSTKAIKSMVKDEVKFDFKIKG
jgi:ribosomal protein L11 methylase PrmA